MKHEWKRISRMRTTQFASLLPLIVSFHCGCSPSPQPDIYPADTKVELNLQFVYTWSDTHFGGDPFTLGNKSARRVLAIVATQPVVRNFEDHESADPYGDFLIAGSPHYWIESVLLRKEEKYFKEWNSPFLSELSSRLRDLREPVTRADVQRVLDQLENDIPIATEAISEGTE